MRVNIERGVCAVESSWCSCWVKNGWSWRLTAVHWLQVLLPRCVRVSQPLLRHSPTSCPHPPLERCDPLPVAVTVYIVLSCRSGSVLRTMEENGFPFEVRKLLLVEWGAGRREPGLKGHSSLYNSKSKVPKSILYSRYFPVRLRYHG